jgi:hypothetical protein
MPTPSVNPFATLVMLVVVIAVDHWVYVDAKAQAERDRPVAFSADSFAVDTPLERFVGCLLLWIVFVPLYVSSTSRPAADPIAECAPLI